MPRPPSTEPQLEPEGRVVGPHLEGEARRSSVRVRSTHLLESHARAVVSASTLDDETAATARFTDALEDALSEGGHEEARDVLSALTAHAFRDEDNRLWLCQAAWSVEGCVAPLATMLPRTQRKRLRAAWWASTDRPPFLGMRALARKDWVREAVRREGIARVGSRLWGVFRDLDAGTMASHGLFANTRYPLFQLLPGGVDVWLGDLVELRSVDGHRRRVGTVERLAPLVLDGEAVDGCWGLTVLQPKHDAARKTEILLL